MIFYYIILHCIILVTLYYTIIWYAMIWYDMILYYNGPEQSRSISVRRTGSVIRLFRDKWCRHMLLSGRDLLVCRQQIEIRWYMALALVSFSPTDGNNGLFLPACSRASLHFFADLHAPSLANMASALPLWNTLPVLSLLTMVRPDDHSHTSLGWPASEAHRCTPLLMYEFYYHFNNLRFRNSKNKTILHVVVCSFPVNIWNVGCWNDC